MATPSAIQSRCSSAAFTERIQRWEVALLIPKIPMMAFRPATERRTLACSPLRQGGFTPLRPWLSASMVSASSARVFQSIAFRTLPPVLPTKVVPGRERLQVASQSFHSSPMRSW